MAKSTGNTHLITLGLIVIGVVVVAFMLTRNAKPVDNIVVDEPYNGGTVQNFNFALPDAWNYTDNAAKDIQTLTPDQTIQFGIVSSPNDQGVFYFTSAAPDPKNDEQTLFSFYQYNADYSFERIYRISYGPDKGQTGIREGAQVALHVIGQDGNKLIVLAQDNDSSPGPCTEVYTLGREADDDVYEILSLDLLDPYHSGLQPYRVPDDIYTEALDRQNTCVSLH